MSKRPLKFAVGETRTNRVGVEWTAGPVIERTGDWLGKRQVREWSATCQRCGERHTLIFELGHHPSSHNYVRECAPCMHANLEKTHAELPWQSASYLMQSRQLRPLPTRKKA